MPANGDAAADGNDLPGAWRQRVTDRSLERARQRSLERGQAFIDAALQLIRRSGLEDFTLQQVADLADQSLRTFYLHFTGKNDLLLAVFEEEVGLYAQTLAHNVERYTDPLERLAAFLVTGVDGQRPEAEQVALSRYRLRLGESHPELIANIQAPVVELARRLVQDAIDVKVIPAVNIDHHTYLLVTLKSAYLHSRILGSELPAELPTSTEFVSFCLAGLHAELPAKFARK